MSEVWYTTRERVKAALESAETARNNSQVDRVIGSSSRSIEGNLHRRFYPQRATRYFDWPDRRSPALGRLWLDSNELITVASIVAGGVTLAPSDYVLRRSDGLDEPPYTYIEIVRTSSATFAGGTTSQRAVAITGVYGHSANTARAGALAEALDASETAVDVTDSSGIGVGSILLVDSEYMIVTEKSLLTTGVAATMLDSMADVVVPVVSGAAFHVGEIVLVDAERMLIVDIAGNDLVVKRAWDGTVLAASSGTIYAPRTLTVERGALGTTAASHDTAAPVFVHVVPPLIDELCVAESLNTLLQRNSGYSRVVGSGDNEREASGRGLRLIRAEAYTAYGRKARMAAV